MPKTKTAEKSARSSARKAQRNKAVKSGVKSKVTRAEKLVAAKKGEEANCCRDRGHQLTG